MIEITEANFEEEVLNSDVPVFVDCYAEWCSPCKALKPLLTTMHNENSGMLKVVFLDVEKSPNLSVSLNVTAIPKVCVFHKGKEVTSFLGLHSKSDFLAVLEKISKENP